MDKNIIYKNMLSEIDKLLVILFTIPITSATSERGFSSVRRLKTFLRSTMTQRRLNNLFLLYIHTHLTDTVDLTSVAKQFVSANLHRIIFITFKCFYSHFQSTINDVEIFNLKVVQNGSECISGNVEFKIFPGEHAPGPP